MKKIIIFQRIIPHYRVTFFEKLYSKLKECNIELSVVYGLHHEGTVPEGEQIIAPWAVYRDNQYINLFGRELVFQKVFKGSLLNADLLIIEQANRLLLNYFLLVLKPFKKYLYAYWGHGKNYQSNGGKFNSTLKSKLSRLTDWWFVYTQSGADELAKNSVSCNVTVLQNSLDSQTLQDRLSNLKEHECQDLRNKLGITSDNTGLFCGGFDEKKRIDFLIESCLRIKKIVPDFNMIFIGHGPEEEKIKRFAQQNKWVYQEGKIYGDAIVPYFAISKCLIMPGTIGLVAIDSFILDTPIITTKINTHSPEFDYLENKQNSLITNNDITTYSHAAAKLFGDKVLLQQLCDGCHAASQKYTLENMVSNFIRGIEKCLA